MKYLRISLSILMLLALLPYSANAYTPIIDPGHGGVDGGAVSSSGVIESALNLDISIKLKYVFLFFGIEPVMVRETDISLHSDGVSGLARQKISDLKNRVKLVNSIENGFLISIHQNSFSDSRYSGAQIFYSDEESKHLAELLQSNIHEQIDTENSRSSKPVDSRVYLFKNVERPAVLVECGFLTNPKELMLLQDLTYQRKLAVAIFSSYIQFTSGNF